MALPQENCELKSSSAKGLRVLTSVSKGSAPERHLVYFRVNGRGYAIDIRRVQEIIYYREATPVPKVASFILGVIDLRGQIIPVISLRDRLNLTNLNTQSLSQSSHPPPQADQADAGGFFGSEHPITHTSGGSHILIVRLEKRTAGLVVDEVKEVIRLESGSIHPPDEIFSGQDCQYLEGICRFKDELILVLDLDRLLSAQELESLGRV